MTLSEKRSSKAVWVLAGIFLAVFIIFAIQTTSLIKNAISSPQIISSAGSIGVIEIDGIIMDSKRVVNLLLDAEKDVNIKGIIIRINSPGGAVGPTQEIYEEIKRIDLIKPIYASFSTVAASGGYYIGAAARKIFANSGTLTGSIGVIMQFMNLSKLYEFAKVEQKNITSGIYKDIGQPNREMKPEEEKLLKHLLEGVHKQFVDDILLRRKEVIKGNIWDHAQGQVFSGQDALQIGLVDQIGSLWETSRQMQKDLKLEGKPNLYYFKEQKYESLMDFLEQVGETVTSIKQYAKAPGLSLNFLL